MKYKIKLFISILFIFCVFISLSAAAAQDTDDMDLTVQDSLGEDNLVVDSQEDVISDNIGSYQSEYESSNSDKNKLNSNPLRDDVIVDVEITPQDDDYQIIVQMPDEDYVVEVQVGDYNTYRVSGNTFADIQREIDKTVSWDHVIIPAGTYIGNGTPIVVNKHIYLIGEGNPTLDAQNLSRALVVADGYGDVTIRNINFVNGYSSDEFGGGAITWNGPRGVLKNCNFENNHADKYGGAVLFRHYSCTVENCNFINNYALDGGAILSANDRLTIKGSNFINNRATTDCGGGAVYICGVSSSIYNSHFTNNNATSGGAVRCDGLGCTLSGSTFENNHASSMGGAVFWGNKYGDIIGSTFTNNSADKYGGAALLRDGFSTIDNCNFISNNASKYAGAVFLFNESYTLLNSMFKDNFAGDWAGAIFWFGENGSLSGSTFINNRAPYNHAGAIYWHSDNGSLSNCRFENNSAWTAGAIRWEGANARILDSTFVNNHASQYAGALYLKGHNGILRNLSFIDNHADEWAGAILGEDDSAFIDSCRFINNSAFNSNPDFTRPQYAGAIFWNRLSTSDFVNTTIFNSSFEYNYSPKGVIVWNGRYSDDNNAVRDCSFKGIPTAEYEVEYNDLSLKFTLKATYCYDNNSTFMGIHRNQDSKFFNGESYEPYPYAQYYYYPTYTNAVKSNPNIILEIYKNSSNELVLNTTAQADSSGSITYDYRNLPDGQYNYIAYNLAENGLPATSIEGTFERHHIPTSLSISVTDVTYPGTAVATITASSPGTYKLIIAGTNYEDIVFTDTEISNGNGKASKTVNVDLLGANDAYTASVTYERTDYYDSASNQTTFKVLKAESSIDVSGSEIYYGNDAVLNYQVENGSLSMVSIKKGSNALQNGVDYSFTVDDNAVTISGLAEGVYTVSFTTVVDNNHTASSKEVTVTVNPLVDLGVVAAVNNQTPLYGDTIVYTITVINNGPSTATDVVVSDTVPEGMNVSSSDANYIGNGVWNISSIGVGSENAVTLTLYATVNTLETLSNEINVISKEDESNAFDNKATAPLVSPLPIVNMSISMSPSYGVETLRIGDNLVYTINLTNNGPFDASDVIVVDEFDTNLLSLVSATLDGETIDFSNNCTIDSVPNGNSRIIVLTFEVINNGTIANIVSVGSSEFEIDESDNIVSDDSIYANPVVELNILQSVDNQVPAIGDTVVYTITIINNGPSTATDVVVSDTIPEGMNVSSSDPNYIGNGVWNISSIGVGSNNAVTLTLYATVNALETLSNEINVISTEYDSNLQNNKADLTVNVLPVYNLKITSVATVSSVKIGDSFNFTVTVINEGPYDALDVKVTEELSSLLKLVSAEASVGTYNSSTNVWNIGDLGIDTPVTLVLTVQAISNGTIENIVSVGSSAYDLNDSDNTFILKDIVSKKIATKIAYKNMTTTAIDTAVDGKKGQYFSITLKDSSNNVLASKTVQITLNKVVYKVKTNSNGVAKLQVNLKNAGTYTASIKFAGDSKYLGSSVSLKIKVTKQKPKLSSSKKTFKVKAKTKKVTATLKTSRGKILKSKKIVFTIKGKKYTVKTNKKGIATANIKLTKKGTFTCTIKYAGDKTYSAITKKIKVVLK